MIRLLTGCAALLAVCLSADAQEADPATGGGELLTVAARMRAAADGSGGDGTRAWPAPEVRAPVDFSRTGFGRPPSPPPFLKGEEDDDPAPEPDVRARRGFRWKAALEQSLLLLSIQHGYALTQPKTRRELRGPFLKDYFRSVRDLHGWADGGRFFTNYVAHPLQGATTGFIQVQNDPRGIKQQFGGSRAYWRSRLKALAWSAASSTQFELGPLSQASIGNVGMARKLTYVDLVVTPTVGTAMLVGEDALDRFVVRRIEAGSDNFYLRVAARMLLNPARSCANLLRFKKPWHRDTR
jgi:hypothetical protein